MAPRKKAVRQEEPKKNAMIEAINDLVREKHLDREMLFLAIEDAVKMAYRKNQPRRTADERPPERSAAAVSNVHVRMDRQTGEFRVYAQKTVREEVTDPDQQITLTEARAIVPTARLDDLVDVDVTPSGGFLRVAAQAAKQLLVARLRDYERGQIADHYAEKADEIVTGEVERETERGLIIRLNDGTEGILEWDQIPGKVRREPEVGEDGTPVKPQTEPVITADDIRVGDHIKVYVLDVGMRTRGPLVHLSRTHKNLVKRLFELEVPEITAGIVTIKSIAREAGSRTKMAVASSVMTTDPVGACVGPQGSRVERVVAELRGEKVDIIKYSENPVEFLANALNPAHVLDVYTTDDERLKICRVVVPDNQLSLAIGKGGQNVRLAAQLTGWKIDIKSESQAAEMTDMITDDEISTLGIGRMEYDPTATYVSDDDDTL